MRDYLEQGWTQLADDARKRFGVRSVSPYDSSRQNILLVHGLDDPGKVWMNLAPYLDRRGYNVWIVTYPNDQSIRQSADFLFRQLQQLQQNGIGRVTVIAHSMGGLVTREMLTAPKWRCAQNTLCNRPSIPLLIMLGTPNHGSALAHLRGFAEVREQIARVVEGQANLLDPLVDGSGEAGEELIPGSDFLTTLNSRPHPAATRYYVIAGVIGDAQRQSLNAFLHQHFSGQTLGENLGKTLDDALQQLGDGLVSVDSAKLTGVPLKIVDATHLSMIRNISKSSQRIPPAIPLIERQLEARPE